MANQDAAFGFRPIGKVGQNEVNIILLQVQMQFSKMTPCSSLLLVSLR
jgi:hypothetical protein